MQERYYGDAKIMKVNSQGKISKVITGFLNAILLSTVLFQY